MNPDQPKQLDARGLLCPEPIRLAELAIRQLSAGAILSVQATDPAAPVGISAIPRLPAPAPMDRISCSGLCPLTLPLCAT